MYTKIKFLVDMRFKSKREAGVKCSIKAGEELNIVHHACTNQVIAFEKDGHVFTLCRGCYMKDGQAKLI